MAKIPSPVMGNGSFPDDMVTSKRFGVRRLQVDSQQTSFEDNRQFSMFHRLNVPYTNELVMKFSVEEGYAFILFLRKMALYSGGLSYNVYLHNMDFTFNDELLGDPVPVVPMNHILNEYNSTHPVSRVTVQFAEGVGIFTQGVDGPTDGIDCLTDGNANRASTSLDSVAEKIGYTPTESFYAHIYQIDGNNNALGFLKLAWEEVEYSG